MKGASLMTLASELRSKARKALKGKWKFAVGAGFIASLLGVGNLGNYILAAIDWFEKFQYNDPTGSFFPPVSPSLYPYYVFGVICFIVIAIIGGMTVIGYSRLSLDFVDGKALSLRQVFSEYPRVLRGFSMTFLTNFYILLWTLLLIIPGIIAELAYKMTPYIMAENPNMGANEAITLSKKMMKGNKENLFYLYLTFIGWSLLCLLTLGIGFLWLLPYMSVTEAAFYRDVSQKYWEQNSTSYLPTEQAQDDLGLSKLESKGSALSPSDNQWP
jgi:uncharacterized membrane protein